MFCLKNKDQTTRHYFTGKLIVANFAMDFAMAEDVIMVQIQDTNGTNVQI